jgi:asparagine synthase (glutamine-hydrolysing)
VHRLTRPELPRVSALNPALLAVCDAEAKSAGEPDRAASAHALARDGFAVRLGILRRVDFGPYLLGTLAGWGIDSRDPTADRRVVEFCLALPEDQFLRDGLPRRLVRRAFADELPPEVLGQVRKGAQASDFHESIERIREALLAQLERMARSSMAARCLDLPWLRTMLEDWPADGWHNRRQEVEYGTTLLRGLAMGSFILDVEAGQC